MIGGTENTTQKIEHIEILSEVTEMWRPKRYTTNKSSKNSQRLQPAAVARGGYTQIVVNPMQLEDEVFTA